MNRDDMLDRVRSRREPWDIVIIGGGATGLGAAVDGASRGYSVLLLEQSDFCKGTSSRSTKLVHGGVRYLQQGNVSLVMEALKERGLLRRNAPHLVHDLAFVVPSYDWWQAPFYGIGMKVYDMLAGRYGFGRSSVLSKERTVEALPTIETDGLRGGVRYYDGQFDDARLAINIAQTAAEQGATLVNYMKAVGLRKGDGTIIDGVEAECQETGERLEIPARVVVNATGPFADAVRRMDDPGAGAMIRPSQGVHIVLDKSFLPGDHAIMVPNTSDGRVLFAIPWHGRVVVGTTDTPITETPLEPRAQGHEIDFIMEHARRYLAKDPSESDVLSVFVGIRPLVGAAGGIGGGGGGEEKTAALSRDHTLHIAPSGLMTVAGGKWTTYRKMAEDTIDNAAMLADLEPRECRTEEMPIHGAHERAEEEFGRLHWYGADAHGVRELERAGGPMAEPVHPRLDITGAQVAWACRHEMCRTVEDFLSRRTRALLLDARSAAEAADRVAELMGDELGRDEAWRRDQAASFRELARQYVLGG